MSKQNKKTMTNSIICNSCDIIKYIDEFEKGRRQCRICRLEKHKIWYKKNRKKRLLYNSKYRKKNIKRIKVREKEYDILRSESRKEYRKKYYEKNKDKIAAHKREYASKNKEKLSARQRKYRSNIKNRIAGNIRSRMRYAIREKHIRKPGSAIGDLGCTTTQLILHLESKFKHGMTWDNYGSEWHIDHIKPLAWFDLSNLKEFKQACHYTNLQPLWAKENFSKGARGLVYE